MLPYGRRFLVISVHAGTMPANRLYLVDMQVGEGQLERIPNEKQDPETGACTWVKNETRVCVCVCVCLDVWACEAGRR